MKQEVERPGSLSPLYVGGIRRELDFVFARDSWSYGNGLISTAANIWSSGALAFSGDRFTVPGKTVPWRLTKRLCPRNKRTVVNERDSRGTKAVASLIMPSQALPRKMLLLLPASNKPQSNMQLKHNYD